MQIHRNKFNKNCAGCLLSSFGLVYPFRAFQSKFTHHVKGPPFLLTLHVISNNQWFSKMGSFSLPFSFRGRRLNLISRVNVNIHKVELSGHSVCINLGNCYYVLYYAVLHRRKWPPSRTLGLAPWSHHASCCVHLKEAGPFEGASSCWCFLESGLLLHAHTFYGRAECSELHCAQDFQFPLWYWPQRDVAVLLVSSLYF